MRVAFKRGTTVPTWLLGINQTCSYLASDQAEHRDPCICASHGLLLNVLSNPMPIICVYDFDKNDELVEIADYNGQVDVRIT